MKKFLIFLVAIVVVVCLGLTTYYFLRNDEVINFTTKEIYCNIGDIIPSSELGLSVRKPNKKTTYDYNAGGEDVTSLIKYDTENGHYVVNQNKGGDVELVIKTSNSKFAQFKILVHIGDGTSEATPFYVFTQQDLEDIGTKARVNKYFELRNDIVLTSNFKPIGFNSDGGDVGNYLTFAGHFNGNGYTISGLNLANVEGLTNAGLFSKIATDATVKDLIISNANITGDYATAGVLAGDAQGTFSKIRVENSKIESSKQNAVVGAVIGKLEYDSILSKSYATGSDVDSNGIAGGLVGDVDRARIEAVYTTDVTVDGGESAVLGGLVGNFTISTLNNASIRQSYAVSSSESTNYKAFIGKISALDETVYATESDGSYKNTMLQYLVGNYVENDNKEILGYENDSIKNYFEKCVEDNKANFTKTGLVDVNKGFYLVGTPKLVSGKIDLTNFEAEDYMYYGSASNPKYWDTTVWSFPVQERPTLLMSDAEITDVTRLYLSSDIKQNNVESEQELKNLFKNNIEDKNYNLYVAGTNGVYDFAAEPAYNPIELKNSILTGGEHGVTIKNLKIKVQAGDVALFSKIDNSAIQNITFENLEFVSELNTNVEGIVNLAGLAAEIGSSTSNSSSSIENVNITFAKEIKLTATNFGAIAASVDNGTVIANCTVGKANEQAFVIAKDAKIDNVGGLVAVVNSGTLSSNTVYASLNANKLVGGLVAENHGGLNGNNATIVINSNKTVVGYDTLIAGLVAQNFASLQNSNATVSITIEAANNLVKVGGAVAINQGTINNVVLSGSGINNNQNVATSSMYLGGIVAENAGNIEAVQNNMQRVGTLTTGKDYQVAGIVVANSGSIIQATATSANIEGNIVAGAVVNMASGTMDQIFVGAISADDNGKHVARNTIYGDKFVAGVVYAQANAAITNVQVSSTVKGENNNSRVSLIALIFPDGAVLNNATVNSLFDGYGTFYSETWKDCTAGVNLGETWWGGQTNRSYNLYAEDAASGTMRNIVINTENLAGYSYQAAEVTNDFWSGNDMAGTPTEKRSFVKYVDDAAFNNQTSYRGEVSYNGDGSFTNWGGSTYSFTMSFNIGELGSNASWTDTNGQGIVLSYVQNILNA